MSQVTQRRMTSRDAMDDASFWIVGTLILLLVLGAAFLSVMGREKDRWLADHPQAPTQAPAPTDPEAEQVLAIPEPVKIAPPVVMVSKDAAATQDLVPTMVTPADQVVVLPQANTRTVDRRTVVKKTTVRPARGDGDSKPPKDDNPPRDTGNDVVCVVNYCLEQDSPSMLPSLIGLP